MESHPLVINLENFFHTVPYGVVVFDEEQRAIFTNNRIQEITGLSNELVYNTHFFEKIISDKDHLRVANIMIRSAFKNKIEDLELRLRKSTGEKIIAYCSASSFTINEKKYVVLFLKDITEKKLFEKELENSFDHLIETSLNMDGALKKIKEQRGILYRYKKDIAHELNVARKVQQSLLPDQIPIRKNLDISAFSTPCAQLGGDYYDFFVPREQKLAVFIADVSGHGVASSLITSMVKAHMTNLSEQYDSPSVLLTQLNKKVTDVIEKTDFFLTALYMIIDEKDMTIHFANAGHLNILHFKTEDNKVVFLGENLKGTVIGSFRDVVFTDDTISLSPHDVLLLYTDGIVEARNTAGEFYGLERLVHFLSEQAGLTADKMLARLIIDVHSFSKNITIADDLTAICIKSKK